MHGPRRCTCSLDGGLLDLHLDVAFELHLVEAGQEVRAPPPDSRLARHARVVCTPHIGASTGEAQGRIGMEFAEILLERMSCCAGDGSG